MMERNPKLTSHALKWGIALALIRVTLDVLPKIIDTSAVAYSSTSFISFIVETIIILIAIKLFRDQQNNGILNISDGIKIGLVMMIITCLLIFLSTEFYRPDFAMQKSIELLNSFSPEQTDKFIENIEKANSNKNYIKNFASSIAWFLFLGLIFGAFGGAIFKKDENTIH